MSPRDLDALQERLAEGFSHFDTCGGCDDAIDAIKALREEVKEWKGAAQEACDENNALRARATKAEAERDALKEQVERRRRLDRIAWGEQQ